MLRVFRITEILVEAFLGNREAQIVKLYQVSKGIVGIIRDRKQGQDYLVNIVPIHSEKIVVPNTADQLLQMNKGENHHE